MSKIEFYEKQKFTQLWVWIILVASFLLPCLIPVLSNEDIQFLNDDSRIVLLLGLVFCLLFYLLKLRISVTSKEFTINFFQCTLNHI